MWESWRRRRAAGARACARRRAGEADADQAARAFVAARLEASAGARAKSTQELTAETLLKELSASGEHARGLSKQIGDASTQAFTDKTEFVQMHLAGLQAAQASRAGRAMAHASRAKGQAARGRAPRGPASACIGEARRPPRGRRAFAEQPAPDDRRELEERADGRAGPNYHMDMDQLRLSLSAQRESVVWSLHRKGYI